MDPLERLNQLEAQDRQLREAGERADREHAERQELARIENERLTREQEQQRAAEMSRRQQMVERSIDDSGVIDLFRQLAGGRLHRVKYDILTDYSAGLVTLIWGRYKLGRDSKVVQRRSNNYSCIAAKFETDGESCTISINNKKEQDVYEGDKDALVEDIVQSYRDPRHTEWRPPSSYSSSSSTSTTTECSHT